ncbi:MucB/RseB C-terminal domain-containing protein [Psychromonas sp. GE-S-Ul-11]|uniref:MucB/RseB C-terminal domain-containing protein n=1 Tax=unclassified Psychromonas TaxID=2614957 RepID=UPI00390CCC75
MKHRLFLVALVSLASLIVSPQLMASSEQTQSQVVKTEPTDLPSALTYLNNMKQAYNNLNYTLLYLNTAQNQIQPKQLVHGIIDGKRITYFTYLNGAMRESLQFDGKISFYQQGNQPYSLLSHQDQSVFADIANFDFKSGNRSYEYIILGKDRIAGKKAIAIRMISKDNYRYSYIVWLDLDSYLPLRLDIINKSNVILEQTMVVSMSISETVSPWIKQLSTQATPDILNLPHNTTTEIADWNVDWLPTGFKVIKDDQHKLMMHDTDPVSYLMLNDGIVSVSVYISSKKALLADQKNIIQRGATLIYTKQIDSVEVNIIGEIPLVTAEKIAASIKPVN